MGVPRKVMQVAVGPAGLFALADDGSVWLRSNREDQWLVLPPLPDAEVCGARQGHAAEPPCSLALGHREQHWNGGRRWT